MIPWLMENALVATLLAGMVALVCKLARPRASVRHALWLVVLLKLITPPVLEWPWSLPVAEETTVVAFEPPALTDAPVEAPVEGDELVAQSAHEEHVALEAAPVPLGTTSAASRAQAAPFAWRPLLFGLWLSGAVLLALREAARWRRLRALDRASAAASPALVGEAADCAARIGVRVPRMRTLPAGGAPFVSGLGRPTLYWPVGLLADQGAEARRGVLTHELAHLKRRDHLVAWLELTAATLFWWNPAVIWVRRRLREAAEAACDAWVVQAWPTDRRLYAETLLDVSARGTRVTAGAAVGMTRTTHRELETRLRAIFADDGRAHVGLPAVVLALGLLALAIPGWSKDDAPRTVAPPVELAHAVSALEAELGPWGDELVELRPGSGLRIGVVRGAELLRVLEFGATDDTPHPIGSVTSALTATLVAHLRDRGLVDLDAPLERYLPVDCPDARLGREPGAITLRQLLEHTSGLPRVAPGTPHDPVDALCSAALHHAPGVEVRTSHLGYAVLARVLETATARPFAELLEAELCAPLGLARTTLGEHAYAAYDGAQASLADLARLVALQLKPAELHLAPLALTTIEELQRPTRTGEMWIEQSGLAWSQSWSESTRAYRFRQSREGEHTTFLAFSAPHKVGVVVLGHGLADIQKIGMQALTLAIRELSRTSDATRAFESADWTVAETALEELSAAFPADGHFPHQLGYTRLAVGRDDDAIEPLLRAVQLDFRAEVSSYNIACAHAKAGRIDEALPWLERALALGFRHVELLESDPDLDALRADPRFSKLRVEDY